MDYNLSLDNPRNFLQTGKDKQSCAENINWHVNITEYKNTIYF